MIGTCAVGDAHEEDVDAYLAFAASKGMRITHVIDTHVHADHRSGGPALAAWFVLTGEILRVNQGRQGRESV